MSITTNSDIEQRLGSTAYVQLTDDEGTGSANTSRVDEARLGAEGEANSYLACRYAVPVDLTAHAEIESLLKSMVLDLAEYRLCARRPPIAADVVRRREDAIDWLARVADGRVQLPAAAAPAASTSTGAVAEVIGNERVFDRDSLRQL